MPRGSTPPPPPTLSNNVMGSHTSPSNDLSNQCVRTKDARSTGYKRHRPRAIIWPETRFLTRLALSYHFLWACLMVRTGFELSRPTIQQTGGSRRSPFNWSYQDLSYVSFWNVIFAIKKNSSAIYRWYYTVARRYEFFSRVAKQYKILFLPWENKIHIFKPPCNVLFII